MSDVVTRPSSLRSFFCSILLCLLTLAVSPAFAQAIFTGVTVTPSSGTAGSNGLLSVTVGGTVRATPLKGDTVVKLEVYKDDVTLLNSSEHEATTDFKGIVINVPIEFSFPVQLGVGNPSIRIKAILYNGGVKWSDPIVVSIAPGAQVNDATYSSHTAPASVPPGQSFNVSVTMINSGTKPWISSATQGHWLGIVENSMKFGKNRIPLPNSPVAPNATAVFNFTLTAPTTPGVHILKMGMLQEDVTWFGIETPGIEINVPPPAGNPVPTFTSPAEGAEFVAAGNGKATVSFTGSATPGSNATLTNLALSSNDTNFGSTSASSITASKEFDVGTHEIVLTATNSGLKSASVKRTIRVNAPAPVAPTITVSPLSFALSTGESSTVTWSTTNATSVSRSCSASNTGYSGTVALATSGSRTETGNPAWVGNPSACTWTAIGAGGFASATQTMTTSVSSASQATFSGVTVTPSSGTAGSNGKLTVSVRGNVRATPIKGDTVVRLEVYKNDVTLLTANDYEATKDFKDIVINTPIDFDFPVQLDVGSPSIKVKAYLYNGGFKWSDPIVVTIAAPPAIGNPVPTFSSPAENATFVASGGTATVTFTGSATAGSNATLSNLSLSVGGEVFGNTADSNITAAKAFNIGQHTITLTAKNSGDKTASVTRTIYVNPPPSQPTITVSPRTFGLMAGETSNVTWSTTNATSVSRSCTASGSGYSGTVALATSGTRSETGNSAWIGYPSDCTWTATGPGGNATATQTMATSVSSTCLAQTPSNGTFTANASGGSIWGNNATGYTVNSDIGKALLHSGLIPAGMSANVIVTPTGTQSSFTSTTANGVTSSSFGSGCGMKLSLANAPDPVATLMAPANNSYIAASGGSVMVTVSGTAAAFGGTSVSQVELLNKTAVIDTQGSVTAYSSYQNLLVGDHELRLRVKSSENKYGLSELVKLTVYNQVNGKGAAFVSQDVNLSMVAGRPYTVTVRMLNTGTETWSEAQQYRLGSQNPGDNVTWNGRAYLTSSVAPGQVGVFTFEVTAPNKPGTYDFQWKMLQEGVTWFGDPSKNEQITVSAGSGPAATLTASPISARVSGSATTPITFTGQGTRSGGTVSKLELRLASGNGSTVVWSSTGSSSTLDANATLPYGAGVYKFRLRAIDSAGVASDSPPVLVSITNSALLGTISGVRTNAAGQPELFGWVCQPGNAAGLSYKVLLDSTTPAASATVLAEGVASVSTELDQSSVASQCGTPGAGHHFKVDLSGHVAAYAGRTMYVWAETPDHAQNVSLPCADSNCTVPGALRVAMSTPLTGDKVVSPNPAFLRMQLTNYSGSYDEVGFYVDGAWIAATPDGAAGAFSASKPGLAVRVQPYTVYAKVRQGSTTLYSMPTQFTVVTGETAQLTVTSPASGAALTVGSAQTLSASVQGTVQVVKFFANENLIGNATNNGGTWQLNWTPSAAGGMALTARGYDGMGIEIGVSAAVNVTVGNSSASDPNPVLTAITPQQVNNEGGGSLQGKLTATPNGTASYGIPLMLPPGTAGMVPSVSLAYDSSAPTGGAGLGWNLAGVSSIERCGRTIANDKVADAVRFVSYVGSPASYQPVDRLCLDGQRLVLVNGNDTHAAYWSTTAEYRTEVESFTRVTTVMKNGKRTFMVESRDGRTAYFGDTADSFINAIGRGADEAYRWRMSRVADRSGNYMSYEYAQDGTTGENKPVAIRWGGNSNIGQLHYAAVRFAYEARPDVRKAYFAGIPNFQATRLKEVASYVNINSDGAGGTLAQRYTLNYEISPTSGRSLLKSVQADDGVVSLPATTFDYGTRSSATPGFVSLGGPRQGPNLIALGNNGAGSGFAATPMDEIVVGDFNGDGKTDILERYRVSANNMQQRLYESNPDGKGWTVSQPFEMEMGNLAIMESGDFDGDGQIDLLVADFVPGTAATNWRLCFGKDFKYGAVFCPTSITMPNGSWSTYIQPPAPMRLVRDIDGDGKDDLILRSGVDEVLGAHFFKCLSLGTSFDCKDVTGSYYMTAFGDMSDGGPISGSVSDDMDADGIADRIDLGRCRFGMGDNGHAGWICDSTYGGGTYTYIRVSNLSDSNSSAFYGEWDPSPDNKTAALPPPSSGSLTADFNGDGYSDLVYGSVTLGGAGLTPAAVRPRICLSKGNGEADCSGLPASATPAQDHLVLTVGDFDGDGMPDVLRPTNNNYNEDNITGYQLCHVGYSGAMHSCEPWTGPVFYSLSRDSAARGSKAEQTYARNRSMFLGDFDGDGKPDIVTYSQGSNWEVFSAVDLSKPGEALDKLVRVNNGSGYVEKAEYMKSNEAQVYSHNVPAFSGFGGTSEGTPFAFPGVGLEWIPGPIPNPMPSPSAQAGKRTQPGLLVSAIHRSNGQGGWIDTKYSYRGQAYDPSRRASLGFSQVEALEVQSQITTSTWFYQDFPFVGMPRYASSKFGGNQMLLASESKAEKLSITQANGGTTPFPFLRTVEARRKDLDGSFLERSVATSTYDLWGNATLVIRDSYSGDAATGPIATVSTVSTFDNNGTSWRLGELRTHAETRMMDNDTITRNTSYTYDNFGLLDTATVEPGNVALQVKTTYNRAGNAFGLVNKTFIDWTDTKGVARQRTVSNVAYSPNGRFVATRKNALDHSETLQFDARTGGMTQLIDTNGLISSAVYDGFGRQTRATSLDGTESWTHYKRCNAACPSNASTVTIREFKRGSQYVGMPAVVFANSAGLPVRTLGWDFKGNIVATDTEYDSQARVLRNWQPLVVNASAAVSSSVPSAAVLDRQFDYDDLNRVTSLQTRDESNSTLINKTIYNGLKVTFTNAKNQSKVETRDEWGRLKTALDANGKQTSYTYDAFNNLKTTTDPLNNVIKVTYDTLGRKTELKDPDLGIIKYTVDALGQVVSQSTPNQRAKGEIEANTTRMTYDELGRMTARVAEDHSAGWTYDKLAAQTDCQSNRSCGKLVESFTMAGANKDFVRQQRYDSLGRPDVTTTFQADATYTSQTEYDTWGRAIRERHKRGNGVERVFDRRYNNYGYLFRIERGAMVLWQATAADATARVTAANLGNGLSLTRDYHPITGRLTAGLIAKPGSNVLQEGYSYDVLGNVWTRTQSWGGIGFTESFTYDKLNRLETSTITGQTQQVFAYDDIGNLKSKTGVGVYGYPASGVNSIRPHAVTSIGGSSITYDANGNLLTAPGRATPWTWSSFDMPFKATKGTAFSNFVYGPDRERIRQTRSDNTAIYSAGTMETEVQGSVTAVKTYWPMGLGVEIERSGVTNLYWHHKDRLGSVVAITDETGVNKEPMAYDAWGARRNLSTTDTPPGLDGVIDNKGFTSHEMLDQIDLVHMNGRVYDPLLARFTSADPLLQDPTYSQSFNRYSYVWNNPTNLIDPSGFAGMDATSSATLSGGTPVNPCQGKENCEWVPGKRPEAVDYSWLDFFRHRDSPTSAHSRNSSFADRARALIGSVVRSQVSRSRLMTFGRQVSDLGEDPRPHNGRFGLNAPDNPVRQTWEAATRPYRQADAATLSVSAWVVNYQITRTKDGVWFAGGGLARSLSIKDMQFGNAGIDFSADYIDDGESMSETKRSGIVGGTSFSAKACYLICVGRSWSQTENGIVGTTTYGLGTPGVSYGGGHMWELPSGGK